MTRQRFTTTETVPEHTETAVSYLVRCDACGVQFDRWSQMTNEVYVALDPGECVSYVHRRDFCAEHSRAVWEAICRAIGADPDDEGGVEDEEIYYQ